MTSFGPITFNGLVSGFDTDSIVKALVDARRFSVSNLQNQITDNRFLKQTLQAANAQLLALQKSSLTLRLEASFLSKKVNISNSAILSATATLDAPPVKSVLTISRLARAARATSGLGDRSFDRAAALLVQGNTAGISGVSVTANQLGGVRARNTDLLTATLQAGRGATGVTAGDTLTITGTRKSGAAVNATFTFAGDSTDTLQRLASAVTSAFGGDATVTVGSDGQLALTETDTGVAGNFALSALTFNDADLSGSTFTIGLGPTQASGAAVANELVGTVTFSTGASASLATSATLLNSLDQLSGGPLDDGLDVVNINAVKPDGTLVSSTYVYAAGDTLGDLLTEINSDYGGAAVASIESGKIVVKDAATGASLSALGLSFANGSGGTTQKLNLGTFIETVTGATETRQVAHTTAFTVPAKGRYDIRTTDGKAGSITGTVSLQSNTLLGSIAGLTEYNRLVLDRDTGTAGALPVSVLGLTSRSTVQDLVDAINAQVPSVTAGLVSDGGSGYFLKVSANQGGKEIRLQDVAGGILDAVLNPTVGVDTDITTANSTTATDDVTAVAIFTPENGGPVQRFVVSQDEGTAITGLLKTVDLNGLGGNTFAPGSAIVRTVESSELNQRPATAPSVAGRINISSTTSTTTPPVDIFKGFSTAGFLATIEGSSTNAADHTDGTFTINGRTITIPTIGTTVQEVLGLINASGAGVIASYNTSLDRFELQSTTPGTGTIKLGATTDTSNFLRVSGLSEAAGGVAFAGNDAGTIDLSSTVNAAGFTIPPTSGTFTINGVTITVDTGSDTLQTLLDKITNSAAGVSATYDSNTDRVSLVQKLTKDTTATGISVGSPSDTSNILAALRLTDTPSSSSTVGSGRETAEFTVDGIAYSRNTNTVDDVLPGVTLNLQAVSSDPVSLEVAIDTDRALESIRDFVVTYNESLQFLNPKALTDDERAKLVPLTDAQRSSLTFSEIDARERERQALQEQDSIYKDQTLRRAVTRLRQDVLDPVAGLSATLDRLSAIGISTGAVGSGGVGGLAPQTEKGFLVDESTDPEVILAKLKNNQGLINAISTQS
ncbi:MAG: flagellar filament capping protein FliD, partial [bacterium]